MRRGALVGDAYVRIHADSGAMDNEIRRQMKAAGKKSGDEFIESMDKQIRATAKQKLKRSNEALVEGVVGGPKEWDRQLRQSGKSVEKFAKDVERRLVRINKAAGGTDTVGAKSFKSFTRALQELDEWAQSARITEKMRDMNEAVREQDKALRTYASNITFSEKQSRKMEKAIIDQDKAWQTYRINVGRTLGDDASIASWKRQQKAIRDQIKAFASYDSNVRFSSKRIEKAILDQDRAWQTYSDNLKFNIEHKSHPALRKFFRTLHQFSTADREVTYGYTRINKSIGRFETLFAGSGKRISTIIGKSFGKGSRNNFLNFTGGVAEGSSRVLGGLAALPFKAIADGFKLISFSGELAYKTMSGIGQLMTGGGSGGLGDAFNMLKQGAGDLAGTLKQTFGSLAKSAGPAIVAIIAAVVAFSTALPPILSIIGSLAGAITALAGSIGIGLAGGLLALGPVLIAAAGGILVLIGLITNLNSVGGDTKNKALKPLKEFTREWSKLMKFFEGKPTLNFANALGEIAPLIKTLKPFIAGLSESLYDITLRFATLFTAKDMQPFIKAFQKSIPKIFTDLGLGVDNLIAALVKFFKPILPFAEMLAHNFERLMSQFLDWTGSAKGQNAIADFMQNAWEKANDVWDIIVLLGESIAGLFSAGDKAAGGDFLDSIKEGLQTFVDWINSPDGAGALQTWFEDSKAFMEDLFTGIGNIAEALKNINWADAATKAQAAITFITDALAWIVDAVVWVNNIISTMGDAWRNFVDLFVSIYNATLGPAMSLILGAFSGIVRYIADMLEALANVPGFEWAKTAADKLRGAAAQADAVGDAVRRIPHTWEVTITVGVSNATKGLLDGIKGIGGSIAFGATGGILTGPTLVRRNVIGGEAGDEALVPLNRPLSLVDPSVRALSAYAQGLPMTKGASGGILGGSGRSIVVESGAIQVVTPNADGALVASSILDRLTIAAAVR